MLDAEKRVGYVRMTAFSRNTAAELRDALSELKKEKFRGLVLDLRFNPGGLLSSAIEVCDLFIAEGRIVSTKGRNTPERSWDAKKEGTFEGFPMVVLVNRYSASASEIVAACLQDHKRAVVMGERTWGKGSVQNVIELEHENGEKFAGSALKLTTASYYRPSGKNIHRFPDAGEKAEWGVVPDDGYLAKLSERELVELMESRRARDIARGRAAGTAATETKETQPGDQKTVVDEPGEIADAEKSSDTPAADAKSFIDGQLRMAIDYLSSEVAQK
jgi:carboxyl-terminal processing protease